MATARELVRCALDEWGVDWLVDDAAVVTSELVTNSLNAEPRRIVFTIDHERRAGTVHITVWDDASGAPELREPDYVSQSGRGLHIVNGLSAEWGWERAEGLGGKYVWAKLGPKPEDPA
ncbi:ATP-binding protein [Spirillospora sp. NPDC047279]|uniref:ATP-binding protein n=1 Tax=Spirillospora sp. NPDC047279 TaxID=3155478 RepID=UPI003408C216